MPEPLSISLQGPPEWHPAPQDVKDAAAKAAHHASDAGVDIAKLAIIDAVQSEDIPTNLVGCASRDQVATLVLLGRMLTRDRLATLTIGVASLDARMHFYWICLCASCELHRGSISRQGFAFAQVQFNVQAALEGLGLVPSDTRQKEEEVLQGVRDILRPIMNTTWPSGRPTNN
jgi:hypothetical protein